MGKHHISKKSLQKIAKQRIADLFEQAKLSFKKNPALSDRNVHLARKIAMKHRLSIPLQFKRAFCKKCYKYLVPGENSRIRLYKKRIITFCQSCRNFTRKPYKK